MSQKHSPITLRQRILAGTCPLVCLFYFLVLSDTLLPVYSGISLVQKSGRKPLSYLLTGKLWQNSPAFYLHLPNLEVFPARPRSATHHPRIHRVSAIVVSFDSFGSYIVVAYRETEHVPLLCDRVWFLWGSLHRKLTWFWCVCQLARHCSKMDSCWCWLAKAWHLHRLESQSCKYWSSSSALSGSYLFQTGCLRLLRSEFL